LQEIEQAVKAGSSLVYCQGVVPVRLEKLAPDVALAALADKKIDYAKLSFEVTIAKGGFATVHKAVYENETVAVKVQSYMLQKTIDTTVGWPLTAFCRRLTWKE